MELVRVLTEDGPELALAAHWKKQDVTRHFITARGFYPGQRQSHINAVLADIRPANIQHEVTAYANAKNCSNCNIKRPRRKKINKVRITQKNRKRKEKLLPKNKEISGQKSHTNTRKLDRNISTITYRTPTRRTSQLRKSNICSRRTCLNV